MESSRQHDAAERGGERCAPHRARYRGALAACGTLSDRRGDHGSAPNGSPVARVARDPEERVHTAEDLHEWVREFVGVSVPRVPMVEGHSAPFDYLAHAYFEGERDSATARQGGSETARQGEENTAIDCVVWANRGGGKTFLGAVATALDLLHKPGIEVRILAGSLEQAGKMYAHLRRIFESEALHPCVKGRVTARRIVLNNASTVELLAQSDFSVRGTRVQRLRCDEVELFEPSIWEAAQLTTRSKVCGTRLIPGTIECLSTMHMPHGVMARIVREAHEGKRRLFKWSLLDVLEQCERGPCRANGKDGARKRVIGDGRTSTLSGCDGGEPAPGGLRPLRGLDPRLLTISPSGCGSDSASGDVALPQLERATDCPLLDDCAGLAKSTHTFNDQPVEPGHVSIADAIRMKARVSRATWDAEMLCTRANHGIAVYPDFDPALHVIGEVIERHSDEVTHCSDAPGSRHPAPSMMHAATLSRSSPAAAGHSVTPSLLCGMDPGYRAPTAILWATLDERGVLTVFAERVESELILATHVRALLDAPWGRPAWVGIDPSAGQVNPQTGVSATRVLERAGLKVTRRHLPIQAGIAAVRARLKPAQGPPRLVIHRRCTHLIEALEKYHYDENDLTSMDPVKDGPDHACDALRYLITNLDLPPTSRYLGNYLWR